MTTKNVYVMYTGIERENALKAGFIGVRFGNEQIVWSSQNLW